jgi:hypothetical protein
MVTDVLLAKAAGETTLLARAEWIRLRRRWLQEVVPGVRASVPWAATDRTVLPAVDPEQRNAVGMSLMTRVRAKKRQPGEHDQVARDGKTWRGTHKQDAEDQHKRHPVCLSEPKTGVVLKEQVVNNTEREPTRVEECLCPLDVTGRMVRADALHTHARTGASITASEGNALFVAKGNPSPLTTDLHLVFREPPVECHEWPTAETRDATTRSDGLDRTP